MEGKQMTFDEWMSRVDLVFTAHLGMSYEDFPDQNYHDMFDDGVDPFEAVAEAVMNEYGPSTVIDLGLGEYI